MGGDHGDEGGAPGGARFETGFKKCSWLWESSCDRVRSRRCGRGPCTGTKYSVLQCSTTAPAPPKAKSGACFSFETTTEASHNYGKVGVSVSWILLALISFNRPILGRYLDGRLRRTAPMSALTSPSNTHTLIRHHPDMCCMPAQPCAVPQMLSCIIRRVQYSCTTFSTALYSTILAEPPVCL